MESFGLVHKDKVTTHIYDFLLEKNLVLDENTDENWYLIETYGFTLHGILANILLILKQNLTINL